jgi:hypothetical protein
MLKNDATSIGIMTKAKNMYRKNPDKLNYTYQDSI